MLSAQRGFTLIELLVVIAIMSITGIYTIANYRSFGEDQNLKSAALEIQSLLRLAQSNSTSNLKCQDKPTTNWLVTFASATSLDLNCQNSTGTIGSLRPPLPLPAKITYTVTSGSCNNPISIAFAPLSGAVTASCGSGSITINLLNSKGNTKQVIIEQGGRIYVP